MDPKSAVVGDELDLAVVGGGAAGFFTALSCAEARPSSRIAIFEKGREVLSKVRISGGGRCNVTHACFAPRDLSTHYPRGQKELIGPFHRWGPKDTMSWFQHHEVPLKTEDDGRVFPVSDRSESIIHCLLSQTQAANIEVRRGEPVSSVTSSDAGPFALHYPSGKKGSTQCLAITSGGLRGGKGADFLEAFGHEIVPPVPSLFTFKIKDPRIENLSGVSVADARVTVRLPSSKERLDASGPLLITHWGLSGPGILKLSAWGARLLHRQNYQFELEVNWTKQRHREDILIHLQSLRQSSPKKTVRKDPQFGIPARLWEALFLSLSPPNDLRWAHLPRPTATQLAEELTAGRFLVTGKSTNKDEFVTCGGISRKEVHWKTMESRLIPSLYFAGEVLDVDGVTGGFNFQAAWTTGRIAGESIAHSLDAAEG